MNESLHAGGSAPLLRTIMIRLGGIAVGLIVVLVVVTIARYAGNLDLLRRSSLDQLSTDVLGLLRSEGASERAAIWKEYPKAYGYRVFDVNHEVVAQSNSDLLPEIPRYRSGNPDKSFKHQHTSEPEKAQWFMTSAVEVGGRPLWIQVTMVGDPAGLWRGVLIATIIEQVGVPIVVFMPALSLSILLALRSSITPLIEIAAKARELASEARSGASLSVLSIDGLPREASNLVEAINVLLQISEELRDQQKEFTANIAHELRTPLAVLLLQISRIPPSAPVDQLRADVIAMSRMVDQLLKLAQTEQETKSSFTVKDLRAVTRAVWEEMAVLATAHRRFIELDEASAPVMVSCSAEFLGIALRNVIENGLTVTPSGSIVSVAVNDVGIITISDRGPGIREADKERVFQRVWRSEKHSAKGAGIGLALVRAIMDLHGGKVRIEDRSGGGCCVVLSFDLAALAIPAVISCNDPQRSDERRLANDRRIGSL